MDSASTRDRGARRGGGENKLTEQGINGLTPSSNKYEPDLPNFELYRDANGSTTNEQSVFDKLKTQPHPEDNAFLNFSTLGSVFSSTQSMIRGSGTEAHGLAQADTESPVSNLIDLNVANFMEIEGLFASTHAALTLPSFVPQPTATHTPELNRTNPLSPALSPFGIQDEEPADQTPGRALLIRDHEFLQGQDCFSLPPPVALRAMVNQYFKFIHPNLPIVAENVFWALWDGDKFNLGDFSLLVLQAMLFASVGLVEEQVVQRLGFLNKREARVVYYRKAKLLFDFGIEQNHVCNSQACLLLTYWSPIENSARWNSFWLMNAIRFAKIAKADTFNRVQNGDANHRSILKRLWWCAILRDRILSLGVRRALQISSLPSESCILTVEDFKAEIGHSLVHDTKTQQEIVMVLSEACRFALSATRVLRMLYTYEDVEERAQVASTSRLHTCDELQKCVKELETWYQQASKTPPFPISLDDSHDTICIFGNMLFIYYDTTIVALNSFIILLHPMLPAFSFPLENSRDAIKTAIKDITERTTDLMLVRLIQYLPISASAYLLFPLILQGINSCAARGTSQSSIENRKLEVFTKMLESQQSAFDGSDFCSDLAHSIAAGVEDNKPSMTNPGRSTSSRTQQRMLTWEEILESQPRLYSRLNLYLDRAFCTGRPTQNDDFDHLFQYIDSQSE